MTQQEIHDQAIKTVETVIAAGHPEVMINDQGKRRPLAQVAIAGLKITPKVMAAIAAGKTPTEDRIKAMLVEELKTS